MRLSFPLLLLFGCSPGAFDGAVNDADDTAGAADSAPDTGDTGEDASDSGIALVPTWYTVEGRLPVVGGVGVTKGAEIVLVVVDADASTVVCEVPLDLTGLQVGTPPVEGVALWWELPVVGFADTCAEGLPGSLGLGIGDMGADVLAELGSAGLESDAEHLYGAYVQAGEEPVYIYGWAAPGDPYSDAELPPVSDPPPDGLYELGPLYLLRLSAA